MFHGVVYSDKVATPTRPSLVWNWNETTHAWPHLVPQVRGVAMRDIHRQGLVVGGMY